MLSKCFFVALLSRGQLWSMPPGSARLCFCFSASGNVEILLPFMRRKVVTFLCCRVSRGRCICLVSCFNSPIRRWLVRRSASTSFVLACVASNVPGGLLSASPNRSCILGGLALLLLVFRVDTSVIEKSVIFVKELSFLQTAPTDDVFFNRNWARACRGRWAGPGLMLG